MQWSKLKTRFRSLICDELRERLDFHLTSYRESHDGASEVWITFDGEKIFGYGHYTFEFAESKGYWAGKSGDELSDWLAAHEIFSPKQVGRAMRDYLDTPVSEAIESDDPFLRAFAIIDRRVGKRTLEKMSLEDSEPSLTKLFYEIRRSVSS